MAARHIQNCCVVAALRVRAYASCAAILTNKRRSKTVGYLMSAEHLAAYRARKPKVPKQRGIHFAQQSHFKSSKSAL
jgi:hypothetical protein